MKSLVQFINESKEKPLYCEWEIKEYLDYCLQKWSDNMRYSNSILSGMDYYAKLSLVRQCEILFNILEKFSDDVTIHFYSKESEEDKKKYGGSYSPENVFSKAFSIVEKLVEIEDEYKDEAKKIDLQKEVAELKQRFEKFADDCNKKYHKKCDEMSNGECIGVDIPCGCECCTCAC